MGVRPSSDCATGSLSRLRGREWRLLALSLFLPACTPQDTTPATGMSDYDRALGRCQSLALQRLPNISANIMVAPGMYSNNGIACRPAPAGGADCFPRANWLPGDPNASGPARAELVRLCMRDAGY